MCVPQLFSPSSSISDNERVTSCIECQEMIQRSKVTSIIFYLCNLPVALIVQQGHEMMLFFCRCPCDCSLLS